MDENASTFHEVRPKAIYKNAPRITSQGILIN